MAQKPSVRRLHCPCRMSVKFVSSIYIEKHLFLSSLHFIIFVLLIKLINETFFFEKINIIGNDISKKYVL